VRVYTVSNMAWYGPADSVFCVCKGLALENHGHDLAVGVCGPVEGKRVWVVSRKRITACMETAAGVCGAVRAGGEGGVVVANAAGVSAWTMAHASSPRQRAGAESECGRHGVHCVRQRGGGGGGG
jgi:hypothetical protein